MNYERIRDLTLLHTSPRILIACDSIGGIGEKEADSLSVPPEISGEYLARVPITELMSLGATPSGFFATFSVEMEPTGKRLLRGIMNAIDMINIDGEAMNGSTEENMISRSTGAGITVLAELEDGYVIPKAKVGEKVYLWGLPLVGQQVLESNQVINLLDLKALRSHPDVGEIVMIGSKGISYELGVLLDRNNLAIDGHSHKQLFDKSGGPATCLIFSANESIETFLMDYHYHYEELGYLVSK